MNDGIWVYRCDINRVIDGDTVHATIDHGMRISSQQSIRLVDVSSPERNESGGPEATKAARSWVTGHRGHAKEKEWPFLVRTDKDKLTFNRYVGDVTCSQCSASLNEHMRKRGMG